MSESPEELERQKRLRAIEARAGVANSRGMSKKGWQAKGTKDCNQTKATTPTKNDCKEKEETPTPTKNDTAADEDVAEERRKRLEALEARTAATKNRGMAGKRTATTVKPSSSSADDPPPTEDTPTAIMSTLSKTIPEEFDSSLTKDSEECKQEEETSTPTKNDCKEKEETPTPTPAKSDTATDGDIAEERRKRLEALEARTAATKNRGMAGKRTATTVKPSSSSADDPPPEEKKQTSPIPGSLEEERRKRLEAMERRVVCEKSRGMSKEGWKGKEESTSELKTKQLQQDSNAIKEDIATQNDQQSVDVPTDVPTDEMEKLRRLRLRNLEHRNAPKINKISEPEKPAPSPTAPSPQPTAPSPQQTSHKDPTEDAVKNIKEQSPPPPLSKSAQAALDRQQQVPVGISKEAAEELAIRREKNELLGSIEATCKLNGIQMPFGLPSCSLERLREFKSTLTK